MLEALDTVVWLEVVRQFLPYSHFQGCLKSGSSATVTTLHLHESITVLLLRNVGEHRPQRGATLLLRVKEKYPSHPPTSTYSD